MIVYSPNDVPATGDSLGLLLIIAGIVAAVAVVALIITNIVLKKK